MSVQRSKCFGGYNATDDFCLGNGTDDPNKGKCGAWVECELAKKLIPTVLKGYDGKVYSELNATQQLALEKAIEKAKAAPAPAKRERQAAAPQTEAPPAASEGAGDDFSELEAAVNQDIDKSTGGAANPPPAEEPAAPAKRGRKPKSEADKKTQAEQKIREQAPVELDKAVVGQAAPKEKIKVEGITNTVISDAFGIVFNPAFQALIPEAMADILSFELSEDSTIRIYLKNFTQYEKELRLIASVNVDDGNNLMVFIAVNDKMQITNSFEIYNLGINEAPNFEQLTFMVNAKIKMLKGEKTEVKLDNGENSVKVKRGPKAGAKRGPKKGSKRGPKTKK